MTSLVESTLAFLVSLLETLMDVEIFQYVIGFVMISFVVTIILQFTTIRGRGIK